MDNISMSMRISRYVQNTLNLNKDDHDKFRYSLQVFIGESSKLLILFLVFLAFGVENLLLMAMLALFPIRIYTGGLHFKTYLGCLLFSATFFATVILLYKSAWMHGTALLLIGLVSFVAIAIVAPVTSQLRPDYSAEERNRFRLIGCVVAGLHLIGFWATKNNPYFVLSVWVIFLHAIQLLISKGIDQNEKKNVL